MKTMLRVATAAALLGAASLAPAFAQDTIGTMQVNGTVMTSTGGEFVGAASGEAIQAGERIMVGEGSSAQITFVNGAVVNYTAPGVYSIQLPAVAAAGTATTVGSAVAANTGFIALAGVIAAAGVGSSVADDNEDLVDGLQPPPVSR